MWLLCHKPRTRYQNPATQRALQAGIHLLLDALVLLSSASAEGSHPAQGSGFAVLRRSQAEASEQLWLFLQALKRDLARNCPI